MPVTVDGLQLFNTQESQSETETNVKANAVPLMDGSDTIITALEAQESPALSGRATANRISNLAGYSNDPETALSDWVQRLESLCQSEQGAGWTLQDDERNRSIQFIVDEVSWTYSYGAPYQVEWVVEGVRGEGILEQVARNPSSATPNTSASLDTLDLGSIEEFQMRRQMEVNTIPLAYGDSSNTVVTPDSGVVREVSWSGVKTGSMTALRSFDDSMRGKLGSNQDSTLTTAFPGNQYNVIVGNYNSTIAAGSPHKLRYTATTYEGITL